MTEDDLLFLGRLVKPHGILGDLKLYESDDFWDAVLDSSELWLQKERDGDVERKPARLERIRLHHGHYLLKFEGIDGREQAEDEVGADLMLDLSRLDVDMPEHELPFQVIGVAVRTEDGRDLGRVTNVLISPGQRLYEVTGETGSVLIPAVPAFIVGRDEDSGDLTVRPIPGLLDG